MVIDTHAHVFFLDSFIDYDNKPLFQYMDEQKVDICSCIAAANKENGGVIDHNGLYQAPELPGTYEITAVAGADESVTASAFVIVE